MNEPHVTSPAALVLPPSVVSKVDVARLVSEIELIDNELTAAMVRAKTGAPEQPKPGLSEMLEDFLQANALSLEESHSRSELIKQLRELKRNVPVIHMTFAVPADRPSLQALSRWLRESVHPQAVIAVGLQPSLVAGVYVRTPNQVHDFSLRALLRGHHSLLIEELEALRGDN